MYLEAEEYFEKYRKGIIRMKRQFSFACFLPVIYTLLAISIRYKLLV